MRSTARAIVTAAGVAGLWVVGMTAASAQTADQHAGVPSSQGPGDGPNLQSTAVPNDEVAVLPATAESEAVAAPAPAAAAAAPAAPAPAAVASQTPRPRSSALPVTGSDVIAITGLGLGLVATGFVVKRRYSS